MIKDMELLIEYFKKGNDPIPYLNDMVNKYNGYSRLKIMAQICSYTILFTNNLKNGVKQLLLLIEEAELHSDDFIIVSYFKLNNVLLYCTFKNFISFKCFFSI